MCEIISPGIVFFCNAERVKAGHKSQRPCWKAQEWQIDGAGFRIAALTTEPAHSEELR